MTFPPFIDDLEPLDFLNQYDGQRLVSQEVTCDHCGEGHVTGHTDDRGGIETWTFACGRRLEHPGDEMTHISRTFSKTCHCRSGFTCGPARQSCGLDMLACSNAHSFHECGHDFTGPMIEFRTEGGGLCGTRVCQTCGVDAMAHDSMVGP